MARREKYKIPLLTTDQNSTTKKVCTFLLECRIIVLIEIINNSCALNRGLFEHNVLFGFRP